MAGMLSGCCNCGSGCGLWQVVAAKNYFGFPSIPLAARTDGHWETGDDQTALENWLVATGAPSWDAILNTVVGGFQFRYANPCAEGESDLVKGMTLRSNTACYRFSGWAVDTIDDVEQFVAWWHEISFMLDADDGFLTEVHYRNSCGDNFDWNISTETGEEFPTGSATAEAAAGTLGTLCYAVPGITALAHTVDWHAEYANAELSWIASMTANGDTQDKTFKYEYRWNNDTVDIDPGMGFGPDVFKAAAVAYLDVINLATLTSSITIKNVNTLYSADRTALTVNCVYWVFSSTSYLNHNTTWVTPFPKRTVVYEIPYEDLGVGVTASSGEYGISFNGMGVFSPSWNWVAQKCRVGINGDHQQAEYSQTGFVSSTYTEAGHCPEFSFPVKSFCADNPFSGTKYLGPGDLHSSTGWGQVARTSYLAYPSPRSSTIPGVDDLCGSHGTTIEPCE